ncbi:ankyrin repeat-containing protein At5g02620-like [Oryza brachyantha]|uniref:ankyrin repeat-containing protein At5g02620-like n=1 Tax=Oryza brachyantha TaxID=4533 RepID=UPI0003EAA178|nr:ankyrin repeat-containing protein At5g02620-like [Oryza brachyantha]
MEITPAGCDGDHAIPEHLFMCSELYIAAFHGHTDEVINLLEGGSGGAAVDAASSRPSPAAQTAANHHAACNIHEVTADRSTLLHIAARRGHHELISHLCRRDSSLISMVTSSGDTPLHCAAGEGHAGAVGTIARLARDNVEEDRLREMLRSGNVAGDTALHLAARHGHGQAVEELMKVAPETATEVNSAGVSPLYLAVLSGSRRTVRAILSCRGVSAAGPDSQNALHAAVLQCSEMVTLLLEWRPTLATDVDSNKSSPLHFASSDGDSSIIQTILTHSKTSTPHMQDNKGLSPLHVAALMGHAAIVRLLLQFSPASADIRDNQGQTFIHAAAMKGHSSVISSALKHGMLEHLLNAQDKDGNTPLHLAVIAGEYKVVSKLLSIGIVKVNIMNNAGHTPSDLVKNCNRFYSMVRLVVKLYSFGAEFKPQRQDLIEKWNVEGIMNWRNTTSKNLAVVSTLIATVAFSAAFNVPGSYREDGKANLAGDPMYIAFLILDTFSMVTSVVATILLIYERATRSKHSWLCFVIAIHFLWLSLNSMVVGFFAAITAVMSKKKSIRIAMSHMVYYGIYVLITILSTLSMPGSFISTLKFLVGIRMIRQQQHSNRHIYRKYSIVVFYTFNVVLFFVINILVEAALNFSKNDSYN